RPRSRMIVPVVILAALSLLGGLVQAHLIGFLNTALPSLVGARAGRLTESFSAGISALAFVIGLGLAYVFFLKKRAYAATVATSAIGARLHAFWFADWGFDWLYDRAFVRPVVWIANAGKNDIVRYVFTGIALLSRSGHVLLSRTENGRLRWYAAVLSAGALVFIGIVLLT